MFFECKCANLNINDIIFLKSYEYKLEVNEIKI